MSKYDVIVVGAGAGGGVCAATLAEAGKNVLLIERGEWLTFDDVGRDHLRNQRFSKYGVNAGPDIDGNPRVMVSPDHTARIVTPIGDYSNNAACVGSGTRVYGGMAWRFLPDDFRMASKYGMPHGSSLADWPLSYSDLEPYYEMAENELGVSGDASSEAAYRPARGHYPMPVLPLNNQGRLLTQAANALSWNVQRVPLLVNSVPRSGRPACIGCQHCVGFACPVDAKNGTQNTLIARALATGNCTLETGAMAGSLITDPAGAVTGVSYTDRENRVQEAFADVVVVSGGAIETARLLLNSRSNHEPSGLGNNNDRVGRNLQGHYYAGAVGWTDEPLWDGIGPGTTTATLDFNHDNEGVIGGGLLADDFVMLPILYHHRHFDRSVPTWGLKNKEWMRESYRRMLYVTGPIHEIPSPDARVQVDPSVNDSRGVPVARLSGTTHPETLKTYNFMGARAKEWLAAAGCDPEKIHVMQAGLGLSGGQHQAGTCRMGENPQDSVTDSWGRVHGHANLYVADGSLNVTNGGFNPVLTILALAYRVATGIRDRW